MLKRLLVLAALLLAQPAFAQPLTLESRIAPPTACCSSPSWAMTASVSST